MTMSRFGAPRVSTTVCMRDLIEIRDGDHHRRPVEEYAAAAATSSVALVLVPLVGLGCMEFVE